MYILNNPHHVKGLSEIIEHLKNAEGNVCLKSKDGEEFFVNSVLLSIAFPSLASILEGDIPGSVTPVFVLPLEMRILRMVFDIKLTGFVDISEEEDVEREDMLDTTDKEEEIDEAYMDVVRTKENNNPLQHHQ